MFIYFKNLKNILRGIKAECPQVKMVLFLNKCKCVNCFHEKSHQEDQIKKDFISPECKQLL